MKKVALLFVCLNPNYWPFLKNVVEDSKKFFLTNHQVDIFTWSDMPETDAELEPLIKDLPTEAQILDMRTKNEILMNAKQSSFSAFQAMSHTAAMVTNPEAKQLAAQMKAFSDMVLSMNEADVGKMNSRESIQSAVQWLRSAENLTVIPTDPAPWPMPTLMRYHLFMQEEERLKDYDYIFYLDADMRIVSAVGDEILGPGLTCAEHPMYSLRKQYIPPYEPNKESTAFIPRLGMVINDEGVVRFKPLYVAGGFQGGISKDFIDAMRTMKDNIDKDMAHNYIAIWNDESHWNKYLFGYQGHLTALSPSYVYPDSLIKEYYEPLWGRQYIPKIVTLTKSFTTSKEGAAAVQKVLKETKAI